MLILKCRKTVAPIISAISYAFELIWRAVILLQLEEFMNLVILCEFAQENVKEHSIWYSSPVRAAAFCVCVKSSQVTFIYIAL